MVYESDQKLGINYLGLSKAEVYSGPACGRWRDRRLFHTWHCSYRSARSPMVSLEAAFSPYCTVELESILD
jgi:hypothetical protein